LPDVQRNVFYSDRNAGGGSRNRWGNCVGLLALTMKPSRHGRAHRRTALLRDDGQERPGHGLRASKPDGSVVLDLPDGTDVHLVSLRRHRSAGLREVAEGTRWAHHAGHRTGLLGGDRRCLSRRARHPGRLLHRLVDADLDAQPPLAADRGTDHVRHRLQSEEGVHSAAHRGL